MIELGCGDGRWIIALAKKFRCECVGIEIDEDRLDLARQMLEKEEGLAMDDDDDDDNCAISFHSMDIFEYLEQMEIEGGRDLIVMYLFRDAMKRISWILKEKGVVSSGSSTEEEDSGCSSKSAIQLLCIGFILPGFVPVWQAYVDGIRVYLYHARYC